MPNTPNYNVNLPTIGADNNVWGDENNDAHIEWDEIIKGIDDDVVALQSSVGTSGQDPDGSGTLYQRLNTLRGQEQYGFAGALTGAYFFGVTNQGSDTDESVGVQGDMYFIPFRHKGTFSKCFVEGANSFVKAGVYDTTEDGDIGDLIEEAEYTGDQFRDFPITITRDCWLAILYLGVAPELHLRGDLSGQFEWVLGMTSSPFASLQVPPVPVTALKVTGVSSLPASGPGGYAAYTGLPPGICLRT